MLQSSGHDFVVGDCVPLEKRVTEHEDAFTASRLRARGLGPPQAEAVGRDDRAVLQGAERHARARALSPTERRVVDIQVLPGRVPRREPRLRGGGQTRETFCQGECEQHGSKQQRRGQGATAHTGRRIGGRSASCTRAARRARCWILMCGHVSPALGATSPRRNPRKGSGAHRTLARSLARPPARPAPSPERDHRSPPRDRNESSRPHPSRMPPPTRIA